ncbi:MAG TPA: hypothetical protein VK249_32690 [Anaerolineales bacterium]|nr:hypothetical protein [Anaerolineales bacterium]
MKKPVAVSLLWLVLTLSACSSFAQSTPTAIPRLTLPAIPTLTPTPVPTDAPLPPTATPEVGSSLAPEGVPASEWRGIPIMPGAIAGEGDDESYVFTVKATSTQIQDYYQVELGKLGWRSLATGNGDSSVMLMFMNKASATLSVNIITKGDEALVLLVK